MSVHVEKIKNCYGCPHAKVQEVESRCTYYGQGIKQPAPVVKKPDACKVTEIITVES